MLSHSAIKNTQLGQNAKGNEAFSTMGDLSDRWLRIHV